MKAIGKQGFDLSTGSLSSWTTAHKWPWRFCFFLSFCISFYSILSVSRCATGPFFYLVFSFLVFLFVEVGFGGGLGGGSGGA